MSLASQLSFLESSTSTLQQINNNFVIASNSGVSNTATGALQITNGGLAVGGSVFVGGVVTATTFVGSFNGSVTGSAAQVNTIQQVSSATYYPVFVDSNNASSTGEIVYTTSSFVISPERGNVGFGVIPSNWGGIASNVLEFKGGGHMFGVAADNYFSVGSNAWYDGTNWRYKVSSKTATMYHQDTGRHEFFSAPSGTADATISGWVNRFQINDTGAIAFSSSGNGTAGQVLQSNGNAAPSWVNPSATTATNIAGGTAGQLHYQSAPGVTAFAGPGTSGQLLVSAGTSAPTYTNTGSIYVGGATGAANIFAGSAGQLHYQSAASTTAFVNSGTTGQFLQATTNGAPAWTNTGSMYVNRATIADNISGTAGVATTATNIAGGTAGQVHYQTAPGLTGFYGPGTAGQLLVSAGAAAPTYTNTGSIYVGAASSSVNLFGGSVGQFAYQTAAGATSFISTGSMYVNRATIADSVSGGSSQVNTIQQASSATYFPTFVDTNNASATAETIYTTSSFSINPSTGNVGIGTNSPIWKLHVQTASSGTDGIYVSSAVGGNAFFRPNNSTGANNSIVLQGDAGIIYSSSGGINTGGFVIAPWATATSGIRLDSSGNLGIGTSTPTNAGAAYKFVTTAASTGSYYQAFGGFSTDARFFGEYGYGGAGMFSNHPFLLFTNASERIRITPNGGVAFGGASNYGSAGQILQSNGDAAPTWVNASGLSVSTAINLSTDRTNWSTNGTITAVVGQLAWKNYGNNHTIFDASAGTSPQGGAVNNTNAAVAWTSSYPTLMGWNGSTTYGVRVDSARVADSASGSSQINTVQQVTSATFYPTFVDSNNASAAAETVYTTSSFSINPSTGNVGINITPSYKLDVNGGTLGSTVGNQIITQRLAVSSSNADYLEISNLRTSAGSDWTTAGWRLQQKIDATWMGYMQFNGVGNNGGIAFGTGNTTTSPNSITERLRITPNGGIAFGGGSNYGSVGQVLQSNGDAAPTWVDLSSGLFTKITTNTTVITGSKIIADTSGGAFTITLPALPATGAVVEIVDGANWATNNLTIGRNGQTIEGAASNLVLNTGGGKVELVYDGTTWEVYTNSSSGGGATIVNTTTNASTFYISMADATSGAMTTSYVSNTKLYFVPLTGTLNATIFNTLSDYHRKDNIVSITGAVEIVNNLNGVEFTWKDTGQKSAGVIAQQLETILPHLVDTDSNGTKSVNYQGIIGYLIESIKELENRLAIVESKIR